MFGADASLKTYVDIAWRRKWWLVLPCIVGVAVAAGLLTRMPRVYKSTATILVTSQKLPENFVRSTVTMRVQELLQSLEVRLLSPATLEPAVEKFNFMKDHDGRPRSLEDGVRALKGQIRLEYNPKTFSYFKIHVEDRNPKRAAKVANYLANWFIEENARMRGQQASGTAARMAQWVQEKEAELTALENQLSEFRSAHPMELPEDFERNVSLLNSVQERIRQTTAEIQSVQDEMDALQSARTTESLVAAIGDRAGSPASDAVGQWEQLQSDLRRLRLDFTDEHLEVQRKLREIDAFLADHPELAQDAEQPDTVTVKTEIASPAYQELGRQLASLRRRLANEQADAQKYQDRIDRIPDHAAEIERLRRDRDAVQDDFEDLRTKYDEALRSEDMETTGQGEQFQIFDQPRVPSTPSRPVPAMVLAMGAIAGLGLGVAIALGIELMRNAYYTEEDFRSGKPDVPLLVGIPDMDGEPDVKRKAS